MKSAFFLCVIFVLVVCYSSSPVSKEHDLLEGLQDAIESQQRSRRSVDVLSGIAASVLEEIPNNRNKRSDNALLDALTEFEDNLLDEFEEE